MGLTPHFFYMPRSNPPLTASEILTPAAQLRLQELELRHGSELVQLERLEAVAKLMDARFTLPILPIPIGLDTIVGLIPGIGDTISLGISATIVAGAKKLDMPQQHIYQMGANIFVDWLIGLVPVIGDLFDIGWQGNMRNVRIARAHLESRWAEEREAVLKS